MLPIRFENSAHASHNHGGLEEVVPALNVAGIVLGSVDEQVPAVGRDTAPRRSRKPWGDLALVSARDGLNEMVFSDAHFVKSEFPGLAY
jgi:hypothetical protein